MSLKDTLDRIRAKYGSDPTLQDKSFGEQLGGIPRNIIEQTLNLVGIDKSSEQLTYERKYPVTSFLSGMVGVGGAYAGALKGVSKIEKLDKLIDGIKLANSPIKTAMLKETARLGVVEAGRLGASAAIPGGEKLEDEFWNSALNLGLGAGAVGGFKLLASGGKRNAPLQEIFKDVNLDASPQLQARQISAAIDAGTIDPKFTAEAQNRVAKLQDQIRVAEADKYVGPTLRSGGSRLNRLFTIPRGENAKKSDLVRRRFARTATGGFKNDAEWNDAATRAGLPPDWQQFVQFPRHVSFKSDSTAKTIQSTIYNTMQSAGDGWYITQEANDGLFLMARKIKGEAPVGPKLHASKTPVSKADEWVVFKTDTPRKFRPAHAVWKDAVADHNLFLAKDTLPKGPVSPIFDSARQMMETLPLRKYVGSKAAKGSLGEFSEKLGKAFGLDGALANTGEVTKRVRDFFTEYLAPTVQQFGRSPRAGRIFAIANATTDAAESVMRKIVYGEKSLDARKTPFAHLLGKPTELEGASIKSMIDKLSDEEIGQFHKIWRAEADTPAVSEMFAQGKISDKVRDFAERVKAIDDDLTGMIVRTEDATGGGQFARKEGHYGLSRGWDGDLRVAIRDAEDKLMGVASGHSRVSAKKAADRLLATLEAEGKPGRIAEEFDITDTVKLPRDIKFSVNSPAWQLERSGVRGFKFDDVAFTRKELLETYASNVRKRTKYLANRSIENLLADDIGKLSVEDPQMHRVLVSRLDDLAGKRSPMTKLQEQVVDSVLSPVMGKNTASQVISATNKLMWHLELGGLRIAYPVMNMLTFAQTVMPEVAFVRSAPEDVLAKYYTTYGIHGTKAGHGAGVLDPIKMWWAGTRNMHSKDPRFLKSVERGINEGILDPRFIEESVGANSATVKNWKEALKTPSGFGGWLAQLSEFLPAQSEKWSRLNAFSTAHVMGRDILGITDDELLYKFSKDFTDRTMFRYGMESRPRVFTTPAGSALGLFKNWMMHYVGMMADYAGEGTLRNNWSPLLWQTAGTFAIGGLAASPVYAAANVFSEAMTGKSALVNTYDAMSGLPDQASDAVMFGLPAGMFGISLSGSASAPGANPARDVTQMFSLVQLQRAGALAKTFQGGFDHWLATGESPMEDANTRDQFFRALAPKTIYRGLQTAQDGAIKSLTTSYPILKGVGPIDQFLFTLGFNPTEIEKAYAVSEELWADQTKMKAAVASYGEALFNAYSENDMATVDNIVRRATIEGVDVSSIERSALARSAKAEKDVVTRSFKPEEIEKRLNVLGDNYKQGQ